MEISRLKKDKEFQIVYNSGNKEFGYYSLIFYKKMKNKNEVSKIGYVASKKTGNAVCRNRLRRLLKEFFRLNTLKIKTGYNIVCVAKKKAGENITVLKYRDIEKDMNKVLKKANLIESEIK